MNLSEKLSLLADAAKYDVSCSSSGSARQGIKGTLGSAARAGICHSFTKDGRCISLLKILMTNFCIYDCAYCCNRRSNDIPRAHFSAEEIVSLTINFYRRNFIEGLFLSSAVFGSPDYTMEQLILVAETLRAREQFHGYIHLKAIPGANPLLIQRAGQVADRLSLNLELPSEQSLSLLAPEKKKQAILLPMKQIQQGIVAQGKTPFPMQRSTKRSSLFVPAGQTTQMIVGASKENDFQILKLSSALYKTFSMKRVYFSAYVPVNQDQRLPELFQPPTLRENRLYQADWLMRFYGFQAEELLDEQHPNFDPDYDPKVIWAIRHPEYFPMDVNTATYHQLLRVPGLGVLGVKRIICARKTRCLDFTDLLRMRLSLKRAQYFITCHGKYYRVQHPTTQTILHALKPNACTSYEQLQFFTDFPQKSSSSATLLKNDAFFPKAAAKKAEELLPDFSQPIVS